MKPLVKICGITTLADARFCAGAGADYVGYIQYPRSPRFIPPKDVAAITEWIYGPKSVGVFVDEYVHVVNQAADLAGFDLVQLHGDESPAYCRRMSRPVIKAFRVGPDTSSDQLSAALSDYGDVVFGFLLDTWHPTLRGGTGTVFDWSMARALTAERHLILSGGLSPDNIRQAVQSVSPWGIDLSSSLESAPGVKDYSRITALFEALDNLNA